jgi:hypothetical protein
LPKTLVIEFDGEVIGDLMLAVSDAWAQAEVVEQAREVQAELGWALADNEASWRLMERVGMRREQHAVAESLHRSGAWLDGLGYALLADEWRGLR